ncbi:glucoamylase family protein [Pigmentiphaga sp.]|uniref:GH36-type glycosyl hydrolase domain-containing protein n=1 Tax=Pigmentiphaga sp. TaxID=1977564 RepID=UPI0025E78BB8|nr:glucoamylase family protein [Pigmentiphaga sp.]
MGTQEEVTRGSPWNEKDPVRHELFGVERLAQHARSLAAAQEVTSRPRRVSSLHRRLGDNAAVLLAAYHSSAAELEGGRAVEPAAEWLLDNYHVVEEQVREVRDDLPPGFYRQLPKLSSGPFAGYPRVLGVAWAFVAHTDSNFDPEVLYRFISAYQSVRPLTIGELWAVAITLRIVLVENLRRLAEEIGAGRAARDSADEMADGLLRSGSAGTVSGLNAKIASMGPLSEIFAAQLSKRLRDQDPRETPALAWLEDRLVKQGSSRDDVVEKAQQRQGASNVSVRNVITSMRLISDIDWADWFESVSLPDELLRTSSGFGEMDFSTRDLYRKEIEQLARGSAMTELQVTQAVLDAACAAAVGARGGDRARVSDPGYYLIAAGRPALEARIGYAAPWRVGLDRLAVRGGIAGYVGSIMSATVALAALVWWVLWTPGMAAGGVVAFLLLAIFPVSEFATVLLNRAITWKLGASILPAVDFTQNVPEEHRTLVAVPTLLTSEEEMLAHIEQLEVLYLSGAGGDLVYALLADGPDADTEDIPADAAILAAGAAAVARLNLRHGPAPGGSRFLLLSRRRLFNETQGIWMGWERKRGKLHELNRLLRGATNTSYAPIPGLTQHVAQGVRYVLTLDADTRLPRDAAQKLIGKMAHPLNRPKFDAATQRIVEGHAILQPRVTPSLPLHRKGSIYQRLFSSPGGLDPYAAAASDVYQDLFGEGSYTGKGIYDIDAFEAVLAGRVPENAMLSHDLFEGIFARAGLASDIEIIEEFPARYDVACRRAHRWTRGDWQLLPWLFGRAAGNLAVPPIGRGKMLDNLRRSLLAPASFLALGAGWLLPLPAAALATLTIVLCHAVPAVLSSLSFVAARRGGVPLRNRAMLFGQDLAIAGEHVLASFTFLADGAWRMTDAIGRTLLRLFVTHRHLLEWTTAAQLTGSARLGLAGVYRMMWQSVCLSVVMVVGVIVVQPASWVLLLPFALAWLAAPACAWWISRPSQMAAQLRVSSATALSLRRTARRTWRFFETFVTADDHMLPPDNFQETPKPVLARRTSPTNIGLYLLSIVAARDFGWIGTCGAIRRMEDTLSSVGRLERYNGHLFNWYATDDLRVLQPAYVSSVDSGNLAGHLIALANTCEEWAEDCSSREVRSGLRDDLALAREALSDMAATGDERLRQLAALQEEMDTLLQGPQDLVSLLPSLGRLAAKAAGGARALVPVEADGHGVDLVFWTNALSVAIQEHREDVDAGERCQEAIDARLRVLAHTAREMASAMDFSFLLDPERKLLSIGYSLADNSRDPGCYDLLASEARLASLFAIAKGDVPTRHWMRLGRTSTPVACRATLISWSGSMFEYLMPSLVMRAPVGSLLEQTNRMVVRRQRQYAEELDLPWGISESAYNARDMAFTYQYLNFGVPGLGLKRGLSEDWVVAPYATALAAMIDPEAAQENFIRLAQLGARGRHGFYEALDFTPSRLRENATVAIVRSFMAHHQGMTIVAIANALHGGRIRDRFHREPMIQACGSLLQERVPRDVALARPRAERIKAGTVRGGGMEGATRCFERLPAGPPHTHLLSNGRYTVMVTTASGGYSRWREIAVTRWHGDATRDGSGSYLFARDIQRGHAWSATPEPLWTDPQQIQIGFSEDRVDFMRRDGSLTTAMQVLVSGEDDGEVRRVLLTNAGRRVREIELTSYAELVLATPAADRAHPAFSKMFVVTEFLPEFGALVATRRRRSPEDPGIWAAHFAVVEGEAIAPVQYETDRARFIDRRAHGWVPGHIVQGEPLSNTVGTVLDPVFSLRHSVRVAPGQVARVSFWTLVADTREALLDLVDKHHDRSAFERAETLAWTQAQVQLRHLGMHAEEAAAFQRLAAPLLYPDSRFRVPSEAIIRGAGSQSGLWPYGISGDFPIVLLRIDDAQDISLVRQMLRAHEYWRMKRLAVDLVILNERTSSYTQDLQNAIDTAVRSSQARPSFGKELAKGTVYVLRADLMSVQGQDLIQAVARIVLLARHGPVAEQLARIVESSPRLEMPFRPASTALMAASSGSSNERELEFFNGLGGFGLDGKEYVVCLLNGQSTPAPWINVVANPGFGFQVSAEGSGYTWSENSRENQLTPWSNDPVMDPPGEVFYLRDEASGDLWTPTASPIRDDAAYVARHGFGYSRFEHRHDGIASELLQYVPRQDPIKISRLTLVNHSGRSRELSITAYVEWVLGATRSVSAPFLITRVDAATGAIFAVNPWSLDFAQRVAFADLAGSQTALTADRREFLGDNGELAAPAALTGDAGLSGRCGAALDPCAVLQRVVALKPGESVEIVFFLGQCGSAEEARELVARYRQQDLDEVLGQVVSGWQEKLGAVQVKTPDRAMDVLLNGWLLYQTIACRLWARSAFYQSSGAYGFRDQLQDGMALMLAMPEAARGQLLRAASRQFAEGDVQHWWQPQTGQGVRTRISDDCVWLAYVAANYVLRSGDEAVLDEPVSFVEGPALGTDEHDAFFLPKPSECAATLFEHCARGLDLCMARTGVHGLPLIGSGDWNDGMNRVGQAGHGESVWLGWLLLHTIGTFEPMVRGRDPLRAARWREHAGSLREAMETHAWDGEWYRRATFDDGTWLGSRDGKACRIDSIAQSWAVLSGAAQPERAAMAMASLERHLMKRDDGMVLLFTPPFDRGGHDPGYIQGYPPGLRENGGQYTHAAMWVILAYTALGNGDKAVELFSMLNPVNHAHSPAGAQRYKVEPYVVAADVYSVAPHAGRGGWTWYTGSAAWMYRAGVEGILGIQRTGMFLTLNPCIPAAWPGFEACVAIDGSRHDIRVDNVSGRGRGVTAAFVDGIALACAGGTIALPLDGLPHSVVLTL